MNEYLSNVIEYKAITHIAKEWLEAGLISKAEYKKLCRIIAKSLCLHRQSAASALLYREPSDKTYQA